MAGTEQTGNGADPGAAPPPFDPSQPFEHATPPAETSAAPPPFDPGKPFLPAASASQWTQDKPLTPKTQEDIDNAPAGSWLKHPKSGDLYQKPLPAADVDQSTGQDLDFTGLTAGPKPPGWIGTAVEAGRKGLVSGLTEAAQAPTAFRDRPAEAPDTSPVGKLLTQPVSEGWSDPKWWIAHFSHGLAETSPALALGAAGAAAGAGVPVAGETGIPELIGGAAGFGLGSAIQTIAPAYQKARADGLDHDAAVDRAMKETGIAATFGAVMGLVPGAPMFGRTIEGSLKRPISEALAQIFAVQPALGAGQQVATGAVEGKMPTAGELATGYAEQIGLGAGLVGGHAALRHLQGTPEPAAQAPPAGAAPAAEGAPTVGETVGMDLGRGVQAATVAGVTPHGDIQLTDPDGATHLMTAADFAQHRTEAPSATTPEATGEPPAAEAPAAQGAPRPAGPQGEETAHRTLDDLDQEAADERAAAQGQPPAVSPETQIATAEAELAAQAQPQRPAPTPEELIRSIGGPPEPLPPRPEPALTPPVNEPPTGEVGENLPITPPEAQQTAIEPPPVEAPVPRGTEPPPEQTAPESATHVEPARPAAALPAPSAGDIGRVAEELFNAYRQGGPDAAREAFNRYQNQWPLAATEAVRAQFQSLVAGTGKPWSEVQAEAGRPPEPVAPPPATENEPKVIEGTHTKTGAPIVTVQLPQRVGSDEFKQLGVQARQLGGYYSAYRGKGALPGFIFKTRDAADRFAAIARGEAPPPSVREQVQAAPSPTEDTSGFIDHVENIAEQAANPPPPSDEQRIGQEIADARDVTEHNPTDAQKEAGNYPKGKVNFHGIPFVMENAEGSTRRGVDQHGQPWESTLPADYGYISKTEGADGDQVDAYIGHDIDSQQAFVVDQFHPGDGFDEHKVLLGFKDWPSARQTYLDAFSDSSGGERLGNVTPMSLDDLKTWLKEGDTQNPIGQQGLPFAAPAEAEPAATPLPRPPSNAPPEVHVANAVADMITKNEPITAADLQRLMENEYGHKLSEGKFTRAEMYDALELGVNRYVMSKPELFNPANDIYQAKRAVQLLASLKRDLPTQTVRAGEKDLMQQFSTPPDYSFAAAWMAHIEPGRDSVLEPSAGTGSLVAPALNARPREVTVNELSANRAPLVESLGPDRSFRENAEQLHNILPADVKPTVVLMNPPFSSAGERMAGRRQIDIGAQHVEQALQRLEPGGRLVAIVGRGMGQNMEAGYRQGTGAHFAAWWDKIGKQYDVRANVGVPGDVYTKYGTSFGTRLLVIDKNPPSGRAPVIAEASDIPDLMSRLESVRNDRQPIGAATGEPVAGEPGREAPPPGSAGAAEPAPAVPRPTVEPGVRAEPGRAGAGTEVPPGTRTGEPGVARPEPEANDRNAVAPEQPGGGPTSGAERYTEAPVGESVELVNSGAGPDGVVLRPEGSAGSILPARGEPPGLETSTVVPVDERLANPDPGEVTENIYEPYRPQRITIEGAQSHPGKLVQSAAMASVMPPEIDYAPKISKALISKGALSDAQLEAITYAGHAHSQMLPAEGDETAFRRGYFIGDGTGVGKGREAAGILLDNWMQGRKKAVWLSEKKTLINDAQRDWKGLGQDPKHIFDIGKTKPGADMVGAQGIAFGTYDTLKGAERMGKDASGKTIKGQTRIDQLVKWLGPDFDGAIIFDEAHNLGNSMMVKGDRGAKDAAQKALAGIELQDKLPNARVTYVSATGATEVSNLAYTQRLGLWGRGTAFPNKEAFISQIGGGGIAAMELVARDMKAMGKYVARSLSYDGVEYDRLEHALTPDQKQTYDALAEAWQVTLNNFEAALKAAAPKGGAVDINGESRPDRHARSAALSAFWGAHQRFFNQIVTSMQMPSVLTAVERDLKEGKQAVLQLVNTNEASQKRALAKLDSEDDLDDLDMTPRDQLMQLVQHSFPVAQHEAYVDENGNERSRPVTDSTGQVVENREAVEMRERLLDQLGSIRVPDGPLEMLMNHFGTDQVAEVTGRKQRVVRKPDADGQMRTQVESRPGSANVTEADAFQNGKKPILVFSEAGGTGRSYHADNTSPSADARRSHYLIQAGWRADKAIQGFGRTHRTNQASAPIFNLVTTDLQGQRRFISSIARRLSQLGALTKGERRAGEQGIFSAKDNLESTEAGQALYNFFIDLHRNNVPEITQSDFEKQTGLRLTDDQGNLRKDLPPITQFLNRLLSLKYDTQNAVFNAFEERLNDAVDRASAMGTLDTGTETLRGDRISKEADQTVHVDPDSGAETKYVRLKVENRNRPAAFEDVDSGSRLTGGKKPVRYAENLQNGRFYAVSEAKALTDKDGRIVEQYRLADPMKWHFADRYALDGYGADKRWRMVDGPAEAKGLWDKQVANIPEYSNERVHLITGAVLPIWDRLKGTPKIFRTQTTDGERFLGRVVHDDQIDATLKALNAEDAARKYEPTEIASRVLDGQRATLANGWALKRSMVAGEHRIELTGPQWNDRDQIQRDGVFTERIGYDTRYFIPTGADAEKVLNRVLDRRPVTEFSGARDAGLAEGEGPSPAAAFRDTMPDYQQFAASREPSHELSRDYVLNRGQTTGNEHLTLNDPRGILAASTSDLPNAVRYDEAGLNDRMMDPDSQLVIHHNHPINRSLSKADIGQLAYPGVHSVVAHAHDGSMYSASLTQAGKDWIHRVDPALSSGVLRTAYRTAMEDLRPALQDGVDKGLVSADRASSLLTDMSNRALDAAGLVDYVSPHTGDPIPDEGRYHIGQAAQAVSAQLNRFGFKLPEGEDIANRIDRSTRRVQPDEGMAGLPRAAGNAPQERGGIGSDQGRAPGTVATGAEGLAEEPQDFTDDAEQATVRAAVDQPVPRGTDGWSKRFYDILGSGPKSPGVGDHFFNAVNRDFTTPQTKASLDPKSNVKWQAELARFRDAAALVHGYHDDLGSWQGKDPDTWRKVFAAMELETLDGRATPLDGRAIIAQNADRPLAALSKPGDVIRLTTPDEIQMYGDYRRTMDKVWTDLVTETARQFGWEGVPTAKAIQEAADAADPREATRLNRAAKIVAAIEYQHRNAYLPLMRSGDYYLRVRPLEGTEGRDGLPGWNGEGYPPTAMYKMIDALSPAEKALGGIRSGTPKQAQEAIDDLRTTFPENEYSIDHGWAFRSVDAIKDLDIPALDKLMMLVSSDARSQIRDRLEHTGMEKDQARQAAQNDYDKLVDTVLDQVYEQRVAGFKRQRQGIPGYEDDFAKATGQYLGWLSNHISGLKHQPDIEAADQGIASHPDPRTRAFWRDWDRRQEDYGDQMHGPLAKLRQGSFYWLLGMNAATTAKIMLHGPLRGAPILSTGLGAQGRMQAIGSYLNASKDLMRSLRVGKDGIEVNFDNLNHLSVQERALIADSLDKGILHQQTADELAAIKPQGLEALTPRSRFTRRVLDIWGSNVSAADRLTRGSMLLAGYRTANRVGMDTVNRVWDKDLNWKNAPAKTPEAFGQFLVDKTVGIWGDINRMPIARSQLGGMVTQFKNYEIGYLSNLRQMLTRMGPEGKVTAALMLGGLGAMGGAAALPFAQDVESAVGAVYGMITGIAPDLDGNIRSAFDAMIPGGGDVIQHGLRPGGIDWSGIGFGDLISRNAQSPLDLAGAAVSTAVGAPYRAWQRYRSGQGDLATTRELLPNSIKHMLDGLYPEVSQYSISGKSKIQDPNQLSAEDRLKTGLGFQTAEKAQKYEQSGHAIHLQQAYQAGLSNAENRIANLQDRGDTAGAQEAMQEAMKLIADGERQGIFTSQEVTEFRRQLQGKIRQRANPMLGSPAQRRIQAVQQPAASP